MLSAVCIAKVAPTVWGEVDLRDRSVVVNVVEMVAGQLIQEGFDQPVDKVTVGHEGNVFLTLFFGIAASHICQLPCS